jgi:MFS family permease
LVALSDLMSGLASGMSIRYFPIFFLNDMKLSPMVVQILYIASPLTQTVLSKVAHWGGRRLGRCQMAVIYKYIGISFLACMIGAHVGGLPRAFVCFLFVARTSFMNSTGALTKSVLMDAVPRHERGKWSALESVTMFSWSGSAAVGGILVGMEGILFNFCITGSLQILATVPLLFLFCRVPSEQSIQRQKEERDITNV